MSGVANRILVPWRAAERQSSLPCSTVFAPSSPDGHTWLCTSTKPGLMRPRYLLGAQVQLEIRRRCAELAQRSRLELPDPLTRDPKARTDLLERLRLAAGEPEAALEHHPHARIQPRQRLPELDVAELRRRRLVGRLGVH